jgi:hypothetical protein
MQHGAEKLGGAAVVPKEFARKRCQWLLEYEPVGIWRPVHARLAVQRIAERTVLVPIEPRRHRQQMAQPKSVLLRCAQVVIFRKVCEYRLIDAAD